MGKKWCCIIVLDYISMTVKEAKCFFMSFTVHFKLCFCKWSVHIVYFPIKLFVFFFKSKYRCSLYVKVCYSYILKYFSFDFAYIDFSYIKLTISHVVSCIYMFLYDVCIF